MRGLPLRHAAILGLLHGPTELLPISSSAHTTLIPWLAGWPYGELDPTLRKSFEVALHAGTAASLLLRPPSGPGAPSPSFLAAALAPPALAGWALAGQIERRLGGPRTIAAGLIGGAFAMSFAEVFAKWVAPPRARGQTAIESAKPPERPIAMDPVARTATPHVGQTAASSPQARPGTRLLASADARDGLALGLAQALALIPGVSRSGATIAAARARAFSRQDADRLSWSVGLPVIAGATLLQGPRLVRRRERQYGPPTTPALAIGAGAAFLSTHAASQALDRGRRARLLPACIVYRGALAAVVIRHMRDNT